MTVIGNFLRRNDREKLIKVRSPSYSIKKGNFRGKLRRDQSRASTERLDLSDKPEVDRGTMEEMEAEVCDVFHSEKCRTVADIAKILAGSYRVISRHGRVDEAERKQDPTTKRFSALGFRRRIKKNEESLKRRYALVTALNRLEDLPESSLKIVSSWSEVYKHVSKVVKLPIVQAFADKAVSKKTEDDGVTRYMQRIEATITNENEDQLSNCTSKWKQVAMFPRPDKLGVGRDVETKDNISTRTSLHVRRTEPVYAKADKAFSARLDDEVKKFNLRTVSKAVADVEERIKEQEKAEEARRRAETLMRPMTPEEQQIVRNAMYGIGPENEILAQFGSDYVQRGSMQRLQPGQWLNDEVIHYFYVMLSKRDEGICQQDTSRKRSHFFKSFFVTKMLNEGNANPDLDGKYDYRNVKRWSKRVPGKDIFNLDKIFFPINEGRMHWICAVAFMTEKRIQMYDSMGSDGMHYLESLFQYIKDEHKAKKGSPLPNEEEWMLMPCQNDTPRQRNGFDCGVFTCMFADFLSKDCPLVFSQEHINLCRERIVLSIMNGEAIM